MACMFADRERERHAIPMRTKCRAAVGKANPGQEATTAREWGIQLLQTPRRKHTGRERYRQRYSHCRRAANQLSLGMLSLIAVRIVKLPAES